MINPTSQILWRKIDHFGKRSVNNFKSDESSLAFFKISHFFCRNLELFEINDPYIYIYIHATVAYAGSRTGAGDVFYLVINTKA